MTKTFVWLSAALLGSATALPAQTEFATVEITSGTINVESTGIAMRGASFDLSAPGAHFVSSGVEPGYVEAIIQCASPGCRSREVLTLSGNLTGSYLGHGTATVDGRTINPAYFSGVLRLITGEVAIPRGNRRHLVLSTRFALERGVWLNVHDSSSRDRPPDLRVDLIGGGTATAFFERERHRVGPEPPGRPEFFYNLLRVIYSFDTETPVQ